MTTQDFENGFEARVHTPPGVITTPSHPVQVSEVANLHAEEISNMCPGLQDLGSCAARVEVVVLNEDRPSFEKVEKYRVVCQEPCDSALPKVKPTERPVEITQTT